MMHIHTSDKNNVEMVSKTIAYLSETEDIVKILQYL